MGEQSIRQELIRLEHEWMEAIKQNDMEKLQYIVGQEYTLTATGLGRITRQHWMDTVPVYDVHEYDFRDVVVHAYNDAAVVLADVDLQATVAGTDRSGNFLVNDVWIRRDGRWQVVARASIFTPRAPADKQRNSRPQSRPCCELLDGSGFQPQLRADMSSDALGGRRTSGRICI